MGSFGTEEVGDEGADFGVSPGGKVIELLEPILTEIFLVECEVELALDL